MGDLPPMGASLSSEAPTRGLERFAVGCCLCLEILKFRAMSGFWSLEIEGTVGLDEQSRVLSDVLA